MSGPLPLSDVIGFRGEDRWQPNKTRWSKKEPKTFWYNHGFDSGGQLRIILLRVIDPLQLPLIFQDVKGLTAARMAVAFAPQWPCLLKDAQYQASLVRAQLQAFALEKSRVLLAATIDEQNIMDYLSKRTSMAHLSTIAVILTFLECCSGLRCIAPKVLLLCFWVIHNTINR